MTTEAQSIEADGDHGDHGDDRAGELLVPPELAKKIIAAVERGGPHHGFVADDTAFVRWLRRARIRVARWARRCRNRKKAT